MRITLDTGYFYDLSSSDEIRRLKSNIRTMKSKKQYDRLNKIYLQVNLSSKNSDVDKEQAHIIKQYLEQSIPELVAKTPNVEKQPADAIPSPGVSSPNDQSSFKIKSEPCCFDKPDKTDDLKVKEEPPHFVISSTVYVPSETETETSSSEDDTFVFSESEFEDPPFMIDTQHRGSLSEEPFLKKDKKYADKESKILQPFINKLFDEGFGNSSEDSHIQSPDLLKISVGLNRPKSLSSGKNRILLEELSSQIESSIPYSRCGFFWNYPWARKVKDKDGHEKPGRLVEYAEPHSFYKQLKKRDPERAREFRKKNENQSRNHMVPYRELRELVKGHTNTRKLVREFRSSHPEMPVYLSFIDGDTKSFRLTGCSGIYSAYIAIYYASKKSSDIYPTAMSTGYEFSATKFPMLEFASRLDRAVRTATAKFIPEGVYFPEPNFVVQVLPDKDTVEEKFIITGDTNYKSPQESPILIKEICESRKQINKLGPIVFDGEHPLLTATPKRAMENKSHTKFKFFACKNETGKFVDWEQQDIINITRNISQSHVAPRDWAINLLCAFDIQHSVIFEEGLSIKDGSVLRNITISLLSRLFKCYDPISMMEAIDYPAEIESYKEQLSYILHRYDSLIDLTKPSAKMIFNFFQ